jgi:hypothetical protein
MQKNLIESIQIMNIMDVYHLLKRWRVIEMEASKIESLIDAMLNGKAATDDSMNQQNHGTQSADSVIQKANDNASSAPTDSANKAAAILAKLKAQQNNG